jgi:hypothetical protein
MPFYDEHMFALYRQCRAYGHNAGGPYYIPRDSTADDWQVHRGNVTGVIR